MQILETLNDKQKQAVAALKGPVLVIAGPGSGKTRCLTHRIAYLISKNIPAQSILAVTFTNKAALEMQARVKKLLQLPANHIAGQIPAIGTFHAICLRVLRAEIGRLGYKKSFAIYDSQDQIALVKNILKDLQISLDQFKPATVLENISRAKDELIDAAAYSAAAFEFFPKTIAKIYQRYQEALKKSNALDFDDMIMLTVRLFQKYPDILAKYQNKWPYIMVDEGHDTNLSQYTLTNLLAQKNKNLWIIADPDQSIYSWRGADFRNILNFEKDYPEAKVIFLDQNYRSTQNILTASHHIISKNINRKEKKLFTDNEPGHPIQIIEAADEVEEGDFLTLEIENLLSRGLKLGDMTVLYRTNAQSRAVEEAFLKANYPYKIVGTVRFYDRKEIKDILAYLKFILNPADSVSLQRIVNVPPRRLARFQKQTASELVKASDPSIDDFYKLIDSLRRQQKTMPLTKFIRVLISKIAYEKYILNGSEEGERRWENILELYSVTAKFDKTKPSEALPRFLEEVSLLSFHDDVESQKDLVNLMTVHCAKGLEFPIVFVIGCEEGVFPHAKSFLDNSQMEEERRLFYVGLTRAKQRAYLSFAQQRRLFGSIVTNPPSRFIADLPAELTEYHELSY